MPLLAVYAGLSVAWSAIAVWLAAASTGRVEPSEPDERAAFWQLIRPTFAGTLVIAFLTGWALREPNPADERIGLQLDVMAAIAALVWLRALLRAARALRRSADARAVATVGLLRCRVVIGEAFRAAAAPELLAAALAHEAAHARRRDPLRIWLAQLACDLQWPLAGARERFARWLLALELRRDDEAVAAGVAPVALAESILLAARLEQAQRGPCAIAAMTGDGSGLALRVRRLLAPHPVQLTAARAPVAAPLYALASLVIAAGLLGAKLGEALLAVLPGVVR